MACIIRRSKIFLSIAEYIKTLISLQPNGSVRIFEDISNARKWISEIYNPSGIWQPSSIQGLNDRYELWTIYSNVLPYAGQFGQHMVACLIGSISQNYSSSYITESADNFTINRNLIITGISWYGQYLGSVSTSYLSFRIRIYEDINGYPELKPFFEGWASPDFVQVNNDNSKPTFKFTASLIFNPVSLFSGHKYWILIIDNNEMFPTYRWCGSTPEKGDGFVSRAQNFTTGI